MDARFDDPEVAAVYAALAAPLQRPLLDLRQLVFDTAAGMPLVETLKWAEPACLPRAPRTGTTIRLNALRGSSTHYALYVPCQTSLIAMYRHQYPALTFQGNRAIVFDIDAPFPEAAVRDCIALALTYHLDRRARA